MPKAMIAVPGSISPKPGRRELCHAPPVPLTAREMDVLELQGMSFSNRSIGKILDITPGTVKWHLRNIYWKFDGTGKEQVLARARALQIIHPVLPGDMPYQICEERRERAHALAKRVSAVTAESWLPKS